MPKLTCLCGEQINLSVIPNPYSFKLISEELMEELLENLASLEKIKEKNMGFYREMILLIKSKNIPVIYECSKCGRIAVFKNASESAPKLWFKKEKIQDEHYSSLNSLFK